MKQPQTTPARSPKNRAAPRRPSPPKPDSDELTPEEIAHAEAVSRRYEESERAWLKMTAPPEGDETWTKVEEHLLTRGVSDQDRRWKHFSK
jgi:hypothetical protein